MTPRGVEFRLDLGPGPRSLDYLVQLASATLLPIGAVRRERHLYVSLVSPTSTQRVAEVVGPSVPVSAEPPPAYPERPPGTDWVVRVVGDRAGIEGALVRLLRELNSISLEVGETDLVQMSLSGTRPAVLDIRISTGRPNELEVQRVGLLELGETMGLPVLVQPLSVLKRRKGLVCFDLDSTLVEEELIIEVARRAGREAEVEEITKKAMAGELEYRRSFIYRVALLRGVREDVIDEIWRGIHTPKEVVRLLQSLRMMGAKTAILSGAFSCFTDRARDRLAVDFAIGNEVEIRDGIFTGNVSGSIVDAQLKLEKMRDFAAELNLTLEDVVAVGDGANDIEIVREAGTGVAYNKGGIVKRYADAVLPDGHLEDLLHLIG